MRICISDNDNILWISEGSLGDVQNIPCVDWGRTDSLKTLTSSKYFNIEKPRVSAEPEWP